LVCPKLVPAKAGMSRTYARHRQHRGPGSDPGHPRTSGIVACVVKAAAENP
jgi:hypothetical protein